MEGPWSGVRGAELPEPAPRGFWRHPHPVVGGRTQRALARMGGFAERLFFSPR